MAGGSPLTRSAAAPRSPAGQGSGAPRRKRRWEAGHTSPRAQGLTGRPSCTDEPWLGRGLPGRASAPRGRRRDSASCGGPAVPWCTGPAGGGQGWRRPQPSAPHRAGRPGRRSCSAVLCPCRPSEGHRSHRSHRGGDTPVLPLCGPRPAQHGVAGSEVARLASPRPESSQPAAASSPGAAGHGSVFAEERAEDRECRSHLGALGPSTGVPVCHRHTGTVILPPPGPSPVTLVTPQ